LFPSGLVMPAVKIMPLNGFSFTPLGLGLGSSLLLHEQTKAIIVMTVKMIFKFLIILSFIN
jgi:hypothetical protein